MAHYEVDDGGRGIVNAPGLADLWLLLNFRLVCGGEPDNLTEKALVDGAKDLNGQDPEPVWGAMFKV